MPKDVLPRKSRELSKTHRQPKRPAFERVVLLLQGGGALGAYQAGVYEALAEANLHPDWVAGISIGAINAAIIAGNPPNLRVEKLREFWEGITKPMVRRWCRRPGLAAGARRFRARFHQSNERRRGSHERCARVLPAANPEPMVSSRRHGRGDKLLRYGAAQGDARVAYRFRPGERRARRNPPQSRRRQRAERKPGLFRTRRARSSSRSM